MTTATTLPGWPYRPYFWEEFTQAAASRRRLADVRQAMPVWAERGLRALRDGLGRDPGSEPAMRHLHRVEITDDERAAQQLPDSYRAEHAALTLFGLHQSAGADSVHRPGTGLGTAVRGLREGPLSHNAAERRLIAAATAHDLDELAQHVRGLIPLLRHAGIGLDYTRLYRDLRDWQSPGHARALRAWGLQYTDPSGSTTAPHEPPDAESVRPYWAGFDPEQADAGADLAALRSGAGRQAGTAPAMWPFYRTPISTRLRTQGVLTRGLVAEHDALVVFGIHQQGRNTPMHAPGISPGRACRQLCAQDAGADRVAVERRFGALLTSADTGELAQHLRALVPMLRRARIELDYDVLHHALRHWDEPQRPWEQPHARHAWDRDFHTDTVHHPT
ncbi:type I-E CRISPR-associated protein Cse2/CasB [Streptomyces sp. NPDC101455]|uniref:type I-E CRISPR-associated protein Cse2/CasB n=1 Tax=Streptomyces sp. NPDC101455 TaxID=3366142 RepID=UPI0037F9684E